MYIAQIKKNHIRFGEKNPLLSYWETIYADCIKEELFFQPGINKRVKKEIEKWIEENKLHNTTEME
jgi:hypothetical protein